MSVLIPTHLCLCLRSVLIPLLQCLCSYAGAHQYVSYSISNEGQIFRIFVGDDFICLNNIEFKHKLEQQGYFEPCCSWVSRRTS